MKVLKFGGSSVGSPEAIRALLKIVSETKKDGENLVIVCSAMQGVTRALSELVELASGGEDVLAGLSAIEGKHYQTVRSLLEVKRQNHALLGLKLYFNELDELLAGVKALGEASLRTNDRIIAYGELLSCFMITHFISQDCGKAIFADTRSLITTDSHFGKANVEELRTNEQIRSFVLGQPDVIHVFTGFIASNSNGDTTTLGLGGSDYTAAIVAAALEATEIQVWTDVDGIMTADPRLVSKAFSLRQLSYMEAIELSYFGAKVIHPPTMLPAQAKNIPIVIRNTFNPEFEGTLISDKASRNGSLIKGISFIREICLITVQGGGMVGQKGFSGRLFSALAKAGANVILITQASSEHSITLAVSPTDMPAADLAIRDEFQQDLALGQLDEPQIENNLSIIAVVGENMRHTKGLSGRLFSALGRSGVNVVAIAQGSSELNVSAVIDRQDLSKAMNSLHDAMFLSPVKTLNVFCCGLGNIGGTLLKQIESHQKYLEEVRHVKINLAGICNSKRMHLNSDGIPVALWKEELETNGLTGNVFTFAEKASELNLPNSVFIDNTGSLVVADLYPRLFEKSMSVVACNKIGVSGPYERYQLCKQQAAHYGVDFWYETSVGAGLPIIKTLYDLLISGDRIIKIEAILSGTFSYIFNNYSGNRNFADVVKEAQEKGFTEPDPRDDLTGLDFARKMLILARENGLQLEIDDIQVQPLLPQACLDAGSVDEFYEELRAAESHFEAYKNKAKANNLALHFVGTLTEDEAKIELLMLDSKHPFYNLSGSDNILSITTNRYLHNPMVIKGPGAGAEVTAAGVLADLIRVAAE
jgi:bifunctional aspartokinase / homoserine dehydrogenase 1